MLDGTFARIGLTLSTTVTWNVPAALVLPVLSLAVQLTVVVVTGKVLPEAGAQVTVGLGSTMSVAVRAGQVTTAPVGPAAGFVMSAGTAPRDGAVVSRTVTVKLAEPVFEWRSVAVHVTVVVAMAKVLPEAGEHVGLSGPSTMSLAEAANGTLAPEAPVASVVILAGGVTVGAVVSTTVTVNDAVPVRPSRVSVAVQVTGVAPTGNIVPDAWSHETVYGSTMVTVTVNVATAPAGEVASTV
jgi:hypothetical protein